MDFCSSSSASSALVFYAKKTLLMARKWPTEAAP
jgi:hypothetical protein